MERIRELEHDGRHFTFWIEYRGDMWFWRVEFEGRDYVSPLSVSGNEQPEFFRALARRAVEHHGL